MGLGIECVRQYLSKRMTIFGRNKTKQISASHEKQSHWEINYTIFYVIYVTAPLVQARPYNYNYLNF